MVKNSPSTFKTSTIRGSRAKILAFSAAGLALATLITYVIVWSGQLNQRSPRKPISMLVDPVLKPTYVPHFDLYDLDGNLVSSQSLFSKRQNSVICFGSFT